LGDPDLWTSIRVPMAVGLADPRRSKNIRCILGLNGIEHLTEP
jgi:hypothetical protein